MKIEIAEFDSGKSYIALKGAVLGDCGAIQLAVARTIKNGRFEILLDLADVTAMDDAGLEAIAETRDIIRAMQGSLRLINTPHVVAGMMNVKTNTGRGLQLAA